MLFSKKVFLKITKILNFKENSKRKVYNQMAKSKLKHIKRMDTHQTNGYLLDLILVALFYDGPGDSNLAPA